MKKSNYSSTEKCTACDISMEGFVCLHHVYTRKAHPEFAKEVWNLMPLCLWHHNEIHKIGSISFCKKYPDANDWLVRNNWSLIMGKWMHNNFNNGLNDA